MNMFIAVAIALSPVYMPPAWGKDLQKIKTVFVGAPFTDGIYYYHHGDIKKAYSKFVESCQKGMDIGCFYAGLILDGKIVELVKKTLMLYGRACKNGFKPACIKLEWEIRRCVNELSDSSQCLKILKKIEKEDTSKSKKQKKDSKKNPPPRLNALPSPAKVKAGNTHISDKNNPFKK